MRMSCILVFMSAIAWAASGEFASNSDDSMELQWSSTLPPSLRQDGVESWVDVLVNSGFSPSHDKHAAVHHMDQVEGSGIAIASQLDLHSTAIPTKMAVQSKHPVTVFVYSDGLHPLVSTSYDFCSSYMSVTDLSSVSGSTRQVFLILHFSAASKSVTPPHSVSFKFQEHVSHRGLRHLVEWSEYPAGNGKIVDVECHARVWLIVV
jgi:hypothetical protein